ncbi:NAD(P)-binding protein, partial [Periconia macrospinosa]
MSPPAPRTIILFGSGPGIGLHLASTFLTRGPFTHIILLARNTSRMQTTDVSFLRSHLPASSKDVKIDVVGVDLSDLEKLPGVLGEIDELTKYGKEGEETVEVVVFNAARIRAVGDVLDVGVEEVEEDLKTTTLSLYLISQHFLPRLASLPQPLKPALLVTNSHLPFSPLPFLLSLSLSKAAQRNLVHNLHLAFRDKGVHVGLVSVHGVVGEDKAKGEISAGEVAEKAWGFWSEGGKGLDV